ncbi:putative efflux protein, MATE family [Austwickia chelonae]|uniref:MatE family protein n=1 Tax=Austwickia chelonae NBRC 105200 TaxID=1184607 RepID=K6VQN3_9MICO|nr:MATE family efflux transporter [Austwickia chelonae]GAB79019.1 MatE family protein [Austwickia chelonae NBRC 105200]SEW41676.1 putative efflux protein, MATE family [Austwickia chelonae]
MNAHAPSEGTPHRAVLALALPAFFTLIAEPLFRLADSAIVGHLGTTPLAGLGIAGTILSTAAGVFVFLAYGTTALVSRTFGAKDTRAAIGAGLDGIWLALALGLLTSLVVGLTADPLCRLFDPSPAVLHEATTYLRISALGLPGMLLVLAAAGILRGLQDTRTPLITTTLGFITNALLNLWFVYGLDLGIAGSAWGTAIAENGMAVGMLAVVAHHARRHHAPLRPHPRGILRAAADGLPLLVRTLSLRGVLLLTTWAAVALGDTPLAAHQVTTSIWAFLMFALDSLAIAGQALTGRSLGAGDRTATRTTTTLISRWGILVGLGLGMLLLATHRLLPALFTSDPAVHSAIGAALIVIALGQPIAGLAFVLDGILIGAGDSTWLARTQTLLLVGYTPLAIGIHHWADPLSALGPATATAVLWVAFLIFMSVRALALHRRAAREDWMVVGVR